MDENKGGTVLLCVEKDVMCVKVYHCRSSNTLGIGRVVPQKRLSFVCYVE